MLLLLLLMLLLLLFLVEQVLSPPAPAPAPAPATPIRCAETEVTLEPTERRFTQPLLLAMLLVLLLLLLLLLLWLLWFWLQFAVGSACASSSTPEASFLTCCRTSAILR